jgi:hypothetical protein
LFMAFLLILALFLIFRSNEALFRVLSQVGWSIQVLDADVKDAVHAVGVEASHKKISTVTRRNIDHSWTRNARRGGSVRRARGCCSGWWLREGKFNQWFISDCRGGKGCCTESSKLITDFIVSKNDKAPCFALKSMVCGERGTTPITDWWKVKEIKAIVHVEGITELRCRQSSLGGSGGANCQPVAGLGRPFEGSLKGRRVVLEVGLL